ncbi:MAG: hypothetical protein ACUVRK_07565 [Spirochaetota bacterium]
MNPHITTIQFDAITFIPDESLLQLLQAKAYYNELSQNNEHSAMFHTTFFHDGDSSHTSQPHHLTNKLLLIVSAALTHARPEAFYCTLENNRQNRILSDVFHDYPMYPFMLTLGHEFECWCQTHTLVTEQYYAHIIGMWLLRVCVDRLAHICHVTPYCAIYPGSSKEIPLQVNKTIFSMFSNHAQRYGITINGHCMFSPLHTVAGVIAPHSQTTMCHHCTVRECQFRNILT